MAVKLAKRFANLFVDEARLSSNKFRNSHNEYGALIDNYDSKIVSSSIKKSGQIVSGELYLF